MSRTRVAVVRTQPETVLADVRRVLRLADPAAISARVALGGEDRGLGRGPSPWQLDGALRLSDGDEDVLAREDPSASSATAAVLRARERRVHRLDHQTGIEDLASGACPLLSARRGRAPRVDPRWTGDRPLVLAGLERDRRLGIRGAVAALVHLLAEPGEEEAEEAERGLWSEFVLGQEGRGGALYCLDGTLCPDRDRPGELRLPGLLVAGTDPVACDRVAAALLGVDLRARPLYERLARDGVGETVLERIALHGDVDLSALARFAGDPRPERSTRTLMARWRARRVERLAWRTPFGRLYEDYRKGRVPQEAG